MKLAKILVADGDGSSRRLIADTLRGLSIDIVEATDGQAALDVFETYHSDLFVVDFAMPTLNGMDVLRAVRESKRPNTPLIVVSGAAYLDRCIEAIEQGATEFLEKPIDTRLLLARAKRILAFQQMLSEQELLLSFIVHDMKQPLTVIATASEWLADEGRQKSDAERTDAATDIAYCTQRVLSMVEDLLATSKLERPEMQFDFSDAPLAQVADAALRFYQWQFVAKHLAMERHLESEEMVCLDKSLVMRVIGNVLQNAIRYAKGRICVCTKTLDRDIELRICNDGPAIPARVRGKIFEKFAQLEHQARGSVGLGLYFCRLVMEAHNGGIAIEESEQWPVIFILRFPRLDRAKAR